MRAILAGGGTGGHVIPALAIAQELKRLYAAEVLFIGTERGLEKRLVPAAGYPVQFVKIGAWNRVSFSTRIKTLLDLPRAVFAAGGILNEFQADVVIGVGGYASGPAMFSAIRKRIPTVAFEPNLVPGFANRLVARFVSAAAVHFAQTGEYFRHAVVTGVPVRPAFFQIPRKPYVRSSPTLLVFGGSQGARAINQAMMRAMPELMKRMPALRVIHQTGERDYNQVQSAYSQASVTAEVHRFIDDMPAFFARADLVLCRSGASTVAEIAAAARPAVFVPFPSAADDHQRRNAEAMEQAQAAVVLEQTKLDEVWLVDTLCALLEDPGRLACMAEAARAMAHPNAAKEIAELAVKVAGIENLL
jgi:UDP-N-acetylglucosamine--N-acetylmuramyl-(pentapeptide) pyrophosphoryl-undecaprenol N-acetylglucosamine transferase